MVIAQSTILVDVVTLRVVGRQTTKKRASAIPPGKRVDCDLAASEKDSLHGHSLQAVWGATGPDDVIGVDGRGVWTALLL